MDAIYQILTFVFGGTSIAGTVLSIIWWRQTKRLKEAEVKQKEAETQLAEHDADKAEVERLHMQIDHQQKSLNIYIDIEKKNAERIAEQNKALDSKTEQIRKLTQQLIDSEHGRNADKEEIARLTKDNGDLRVELEYHKAWRCERTDCQDPRGPRPPRDELKGLRYNPPKKAIKK